jgi:ABC-type dipeptide/oligopeptide/nickel transport system permease component
VGRGRGAAPARRPPLTGPLLQGTILVLALFFVVLNLAVDVVQTALDPRIERR